MRYTALWLFWAKVTLIGIVLAFIQATYAETDSTGSIIPDPNRNPNDPVNIQTIVPETFNSSDISHYTTNTSEPDQVQPIINPSRANSIGCPSGYTLTKLIVDPEITEEVKDYRLCFGGYASYCSSKPDKYYPVQMGATQLFTCQKIVNKWEKVN